MTTFLVYRSGVYPLYALVAVFLQIPNLALIERMRSFPASCLSGCVDFDGGSL